MGAKAGELTPVCRSCGRRLTEDNWYPSRRANHSYLCKSCSNREKTKWRRKHPERSQAYQREYMKTYQPKYLSDPERRERHREKGRVAIRKYLSDPANRAKKVEYMRNYYLRKKRKKEPDGEAAQAPSDAEV